MTALLLDVEECEGDELDGMLLFEAVLSKSICTAADDQLEGK